MTKQLKQLAIYITPEIVKHLERHKRATGQPTTLTVRNIIRKHFQIPLDEIPESERGLK